MRTFPPVILQVNNIDNYLAERFLLGIKPKSQRIVWLLVVSLLLMLGFYLRLEQFWFNRSLWLDEAFIASQIARGEWVSFFALPMEYSHFVPPMFAVMEKLCVVLWGDNDLSLRIYPQLCSLLSLPIFYGLTRRLLTPWATLISLFLFVISPELIFHASNLKQYSSDVMFTVGLLLAFTYLPVSEQSNFNRSLMLFALLGAVILWFSHPSLFILASIGLYLGCYYLYLKNWSASLKVMAVGIFWISSFALLYFVVNGGDAHNSSPIAAWLFEFWHVHHKGFLPGLGEGGGGWLKEAVGKFFHDVAGFKRPLFAIVLAVAGMLALLRQQKRLLILLLLPLLISLLASYFERYVFSGRLILFLVPFVIIFIGIGGAEMEFHLRSWRDKPYFNFILSSLLVITFLVLSINFPLSKDKVIEESKPALQYLQEHQQANDLLYVYHWADPAFHYYAAQYGFDYSSCGHITSPATKKGAFKEVDYYWSQKKNLLVKTREDTNCILGFSESHTESAPELEMLRGQGRVWLFFAHISAEQRQKFLNQLAQTGRLVDEKTYPGTSLHLYDMGSLN